MVCTDHHGRTPRTSCWNSPSYTQAELDALADWVAASPTHQVVAGCDGSSNDPVCDRLGFTVTTDSDSYGFVADLEVNPINCDRTITFEDRINMAGGVGGYFSGSAVTADNTVAIHETGGVADPSKPIIIYTGRYFLTSDINMIQDGGTEVTISPGPGVSTINDRVIMNAFSGLADVASGLALCSSAAPTTTTLATTTTLETTTTAVETTTTVADTSTTVATSTTTEAETTTTEGQNTSTTQAGNLGANDDNNPDNDEVDEGTLVRTGSDPRAGIAVGFALLVLGAGLVVVRRRALA